MNNAEIVAGCSFVEDTTVTIVKGLKELDKLTDIKGFENVASLTLTGIDKLSSELDDVLGKLYALEDNELMQDLHHRVMDAVKGYEVYVAVLYTMIGGEL